MNRLFLSALLLVAVATLLGLAVAAHPGYVLVSYGSFLYEAGVWSTLVLLLLVTLAIWGVRLALRAILASGGLLYPWSRRHRARRLDQAARLGLLDLAEGHWQSALRHLRRAARADSQPLVLYLGAARAANELGRHAESDAFLEQALQSDSRAGVAVGLARTRLLIDRGELQQALQAVRALHAEQPQHAQVLRLEQRLLVELRDWDGLCHLLPQLRRRHVLSDADLLRLERSVWINALASSGEATGESALAALHERWRQLPASLRHDAQVLVRYVLRLEQLGAGREAAPLLAEAINDHYQAELVYLYGRVAGSDAARQLRQAESWLKQHPADPVLLLTLGRLSAANRLWGKARDYFEASLGLLRSAETCAELGQLLLQLGDAEQSSRLFREGLELAALQRPSGLPAWLPTARG